MPTDEHRGGTWMTGSDGHRWFFDSGSISLDFAYSGDLGYGRPQWESLREPSDLGTWLTTRFSEPAAAVDASGLAAAKSLRNAISLVARALVDGQAPSADDVDTINEIAAGAPLAPRLGGGSRRPPAPTTERMLTTIARDAIHTLSADPGRLRRCSADDCSLLFLDTSRPGSRRWCSMSRCGGRAKARTHYRRHREGDGHV